MADSIVQNAADSEQAIGQLDRLAGEIQVLASRIEALAHAADDAVDYSEEDEEKRATLSRASLLIQTIEETAARINAFGEEVETNTLQLKRL